jgi:hypothetical protein
VNRRRTSVAAALAAACAVSVSACSQTVAGTPVASGGDAKAVPVVTPAQAPAQQQQYDYVSAPVQFDSRGGQYGDQPYPGITFGQDRGPDQVTWDCTAGPMVHATDHIGIGFITAGHCDQITGNQVYIFSDYAGSQSIPAGTYSGARRDTPRDTAVLWTDVPTAPDAAWIAHKFPVAGVMTVAEVRKLKAGTPICIDAAVSGVVCTPLTRTTDTDIEYPHVTTGGDSGSAIFVVDHATKHAHLVGIHGGLDSLGDGEAAYLAPALDRLNAAAVIALP